MTAPIADSADVAPVDDVALGELALADLLDHSKRMHRSNTEHDPVRCLVCFGVR